MPSSSIPLKDSRVVILGAGPTGLGAANRLLELGFSNFTIFEKEAHAGGLASSFTDANGFTWDVGGHVQFSHYEYFDRLMDSLLEDEWLLHERESWIWIAERFVPYPFQNNIRHLPKQQMKECLRGLIQAARPNHTATPANFEEWIWRSYGEGIAQHFMLPYNFKVWAWPLREMSFHWIGDRVAQPDLERIVFNILEERDDVSWGPNNKFRFPLHGGTGEIWRRLARRMPEGKLVFNRSLERLDTNRKKLFFADGRTEDYDILISTIPLDVLVERSDLGAVQGAVSGLRHSTVHIVGIGLKGSPAPAVAKKCWMYFPESNSPFYRATVFSNYSHQNVPDIQKYWSLMLEVSESPAKPVDSACVLPSVIDGLLNTRLIESRNHVVDTWQYTAHHGYPTPSLGRDQALGALQPALEAVQVYSRGRFGAWKYEVSNQDHSLMQGVELINRLAGEGQEPTLNTPDLVNRPRKS
jgi:protoporphyrinogen oxidase